MVAADDVVVVGDPLANAVPAGVDVGVGLQVGVAQGLEAQRIGEWQRAVGRVGVRVGRPRRGGRVGERVGSQEGRRVRIVGPGGRRDRGSASPGRKPCRPG